MAELGETFSASPRSPAVVSAGDNGYPSSAGGTYTSNAGNLDHPDFSTYLPVDKQIPVARPTTPQLITYRMRGTDVDCATLTYRYWYAVGAPDFSGVLYTGPKCGASPLVEIRVVDNTAP